jgi:hypothetical protein
MHFRYFLQPYTIDFWAVGGGFTSAALYFYLNPIVLPPVVLILQMLDFSMLDLRTSASAFRSPSYFCAELYC